MNIVARSLLCIGMGWAMSCAAQQPGTLDSSFAGDGTFELTEAVHLPWLMATRVKLITMDEYGNGVFGTFSSDSLKFFRVLSTGQLDSAFHGGVLHIAATEISTIFGIGPASFIMMDHFDEGAHVQLLSDSARYMLRFTRDVLIDTTFGTGGLAEIDWMHLPDQSLERIIKLSTGGYIISGRCGLSIGCDPDPHAYIMRLDPSLTLDTTFGNGGSVLFLSSWNCNTMSIEGVLELPGPRFAVGLTDHAPSMSACGQSWVRILSDNGAQSSSTTVGPGIGAWDRTIYAFDRSAAGDVLVAAGSDKGKIWKVASNGVAASLEDIWYETDGLVHHISSNVDGSLHLSKNNSWMVGRRHPDLTRDQGFGVAHDLNDWGTRWAQYPYPSSPWPQVPLATITELIVQPDGKLMVNGSSLLARYHNIPDPRAKLDLRLFLGGCWDPNTVLMHDSLRVQGLIPLQQPYPAPDFMPANGVGAGMTSASVLDESGPEAAVDWVWLDLLSAADTAAVVATRAGLVRRNGRVTSPINHDPIDFSVGAGSYFLRVRHRNHLGVTLSVPLALSDSVVAVDLTDPATATFGVQAQQESHGVHMLWPGDATSDGLVRYAGAGNDRDAVLVAIGGTPPTAITTGYLPADVNLDGVVKYAGADNDRDLILMTIGGVQPTAVRMEQRP